LKAIQEQLNTTYNGLVKEVNLDELTQQRAAAKRKQQSDQEKQDQSTQLNIMVRLENIKSVDQQLMLEQRNLDSLQRKF